MEVAIHNILYFRKLYPDEIFIKKKVYGTAVNISQHPELNEYIKEVLICAKNLIDIDQKSIKSVNLLFLNSNKKPIEQYVFRLEQFKNNKNE